MGGGQVLVESGVGRGVEVVLHPDDFFSLWVVVGRGPLAES